MSTFSTDTYTAQKPDRTNTSRLTNPNVASGRLEFMSIPYTIPASSAPATGDILNLCELPPGVIPCPAYSNITCSADPGTTLIIDIGTAANADGWCDGAVCDAGKQVQCNAPVAADWNLPTPLVADTGATNATVYATFDTISTLTAGVVVYFNLAFKRNI
jgi:hypothetical protein